MITNYCHREISRDDYAAADGIARTASDLSDAAYGWFVVAECFAVEDMIRLGMIDDSGVADWNVVRAYVAAVTEQHADIVADDDTLRDATVRTWDLFA